MRRATCTPQAGNPIPPGAARCGGSAATLCAAVSLASAFVSGVPGTNGLACDRDGNLWNGDGTTGLGRVWRIGAAGGVCEPAFIRCAEAFRIQPMANIASVGRQAY